MNNNSEISNRSIIKLIITLSSSIILANILQISYQFIDSYWVWKLWTWAIATTTVSSTFIFLMISFWIWLATCGFNIDFTILWKKRYKNGKSYCKSNHTYGKYCSNNYMNNMILTYTIYIIFNVNWKRYSWTDNNLPENIFYIISI